MKKILAIVVACLYLAITSGLVLQIHYCMGTQTGSTLQFAEVESHACSKCGMENAKNKCCHDEVKFIKLQDVHQQVNADYQLTPPVAPQPEFHLFDPAPIFNTDASAVSCNDPPDDDAGQPSIFLLHCVFRI